MNGEFKVKLNTGSYVGDKSSASDDLVLQAFR